MTGVSVRVVRDTIIPRSPTLDLREKRNHGTHWDTARASPAHVARVPGVECSAGLSTGGTHRGRCSRANRCSPTGRRRSWAGRRGSSRNGSPCSCWAGCSAKLMGDSGSVSAIAQYLTKKLGTSRTMLAVVVASAVVTYGGVSVFVAFFVLVPMAHEMFRAADIPRRLIPATVGLGAFTFTMSVMPGTPSINNAIPMPYFGTTTFAAPGLSIIASAIICRLRHVVARPRRRRPRARLAKVTLARLEPLLSLTRWFASRRRRRAISIRPSYRMASRPTSGPPFALAVLPLVVVIAHEFPDVACRIPATRFFVPGQSTSGAAPRSGPCPASGQSIVALAAANLTVILINFRRLPSPRESLDAGANSAALPMLMIASLVGFGAVVAALPAFAVGSRCGILDSGRTAGLIGRRYECAGGADRYCLWRYGNCTQCIWRPTSCVLPLSITSISN